MLHYPIPAEKLIVLCADTQSYPLNNEMLHLARQNAKHAMSCYFLETDVGDG